MWNLCWTKRHRHRLFSEYLVFPINTVSPIHHNHSLTHSLIHYQWCMISAIDSVIKTPHLSANSCHLYIICNFLSPLHYMQTPVTFTSYANSCHLYIIFQSLFLEFHSINFNSIPTPQPGNCLHIYYWGCPNSKVPQVTYIKWEVILVFNADHSWLSKSITFQDNS